MPENKISVIVPSWRRPADLRRCLHAIGQQSRAADEIVVVVREEDRESLEVIGTFRPLMPALRQAVVAESGVIAALNRGLDDATGDLLVFTDDDSEPCVDWLEQIEKSFENESIGGVGGRDWIQTPEKSELFSPAPVSRVGTLSWYGIMYGNHHCPVQGHARRVMFLKGVNMAFRRKALGSYHIDSSLRGSGAQVGWELDLCWRTTQAGFGLLFDDRILVKHYSSPRAEGQDRDQLVGTLFRDISFNNHYLATKRFGFVRAFTYFCNQRLLGSRYMPGLLAGLKWFFKGDPQTWGRFVQMAEAGLAGFRVGRIAKAAEAQSVSREIRRAHAARLHQSMTRAELKPCRGMKEFHS